MIYTSISTKKENIFPRFGDLILFGGRELILERMFITALIARMGLVFCGVRLKQGK